MLKLYYVPHTCALASHIALEEAGADYEGIRLSFEAEDQKKPEYLAINPKARVPALITEQGVLTETPAILVYICQQYPDANMAPLDDPFALARVQEFNAYLCSSVHVAHAHRMRGHRWSDDPTAHAAMRAFVPQSVGAAFQLIEDEMLAGPYVMGADCTICDFYLYTLTQWLDGDGVDIATLPKIQDHHKRLGERPSVKRALEQEFA